MHVLCAFATVKSTDDFSLIYGGFNLVKTFEDLVVDFDSYVALTGSFYM